MYKGLIVLRTVSQLISTPLWQGQKWESVKVLLRKWNSTRGALFLFLCFFLFVKEKHLHFLKLLGIPRDFASPFY